MKKIVLLLAVALSFLHASSQSCRVEITNIIALGPGNPPPALHISVEGRVIGGSCSKVEVTLCCAPATEPGRCPRKETVTVNPNGNWVATFKDMMCDCSTGKFAVVAFARCLDNPACTPGTREASFPCPPVSTCCVVNSVTHTVGDCIDDGSGCRKRRIRFVPNVSGTCDSYTWNFGDSSPPESGLGTPGPKEHDYAQPPASFPTLTLNKAGCLPVSFQITDVEDFPLCEDCPAAASINLSGLTTNACRLTGTISATFCEAQYITCIIDYGDGNSTTIDPEDLNGYVVNHTYSGDGNKTIRVTLVKNGSNCVFTRTVTVTNCCANCGDDDDEGDGGGGCGLKFWECFEWSWCWILALLGGIVVTARLIALAFGWGITWPATLSIATLLEALGLVLLLWLMAACPCETAAMVMMGALVAVITIIVMLIGGVTLPKWLEALIVGIILIIGMAIYLGTQC